LSPSANSNDFSGELFLATCSVFGENHRLPVGRLQQADVS
jgi:hypothetical protein